MKNLFSEILNMSLTASVVILFVLAARLALKKAPKIFSYALWAVVLFRLLCPVSLTAPVSVLGVVKPQVVESEGMTSSITYVPAEYLYQEPVQVQPQPQSQTVTQPEARTEKQAVSAVTIAAWVWLAGAAIMALRSVAEYLQLRRRLVGAVPFRGNVYLADHISTAFVLGILRPKIYVPSGLPGQERRYIVAHERHHIRRGDHIIKLLAYFALSIHWFNPLVWIAFVQAGKDMEMSCDEAVVKRLGSQIRADYSASLLRLATGHRIIAGTPLAFGEGDTKGRIRNMAKWKKPKGWVSLVCILLCILILAVCGLNPQGDRGTEVVLQDFSVSIPESYTIGKNSDGSFTFFDGETEIGGLVLRTSPFELKFGENYAIEEGNSYEWLEALGIPDVRSDWTVGMTDSKHQIDFLEGMLKVNCHPVNEENQGTLHFLSFGTGNDVYDLWFDRALTEDKTMESILDTVSLDASQNGENEEKTAFETVKAVLDTVQSGAWQIRAEKINETWDGPLGHVIDTYYDGNNWAWVCEITVEGENQSDGGDYYNRQAWLHHKGYYYHNQSTWGQRGAIQWEAGNNVTAEDEETLKQGLFPKLGCLDLEKVSISNLLTGKDDTGKWISFWVEEPYAPTENYGDGYTARFRFDAQGNFLQAEYRVNENQDYAFTVTESIVSLDAETVAEQIESYYSYGIPVPEAEGTPVAVGTDIVTSVDLVQYGVLTMALPDGYTCREESGSVILTKDGSDVGGITCWNYPEFQPSDIIELRKEAYGVPIGYMSGSSAYGGWEIEVFWDGNSEGLDEEHQFFIDGDIIYDVWYDQNQISDGQASHFLKTITISGEPVVTPDPSEEDELAKCKAVLDMVQSGSCGISSVRENTGTAYLNGYSKTTFYQQNENWLSMTEIPESGSSSFFWYMEVDGIHYNTERTGWNENGPIWAEQTPVEVVKPWLLTFQWDEEKVSYEGTVVNGGEETVMLRIDEPYPDGEDSSGSYFVSFVFADGSAFLRARLQVNLFQDDAFNTMESILTLDAETVAAEIEKEYTRTVK